MTSNFMTLSDQIFLLLRERIIGGELTSDMAIRQDALATELGVSRVPLREAFMRLEQEGLVVSQANKGFFVSPMSADEVEEVRLLRLDLEPPALALASAKATPADHEKVFQLLSELNRSEGRSNFEIGRLKRQFLVALTIPANRPITTQMIERLSIVSERYLGILLKGSAWSNSIQRAHENLFDAWRTGRGQEVARITRDHIEELFRDLGKRFAA